MPQFRYSKWDGTQVGFEFDADDIFEELTDELLYHGDLNQALQRLMQRGFMDRNGERVRECERSSKSCGAPARNA